MIEIATLLKGGVGLVATIALCFGILMVFAAGMSSNPQAGASASKAGCTVVIIALIVLIALIVMAIVS